MFVSADYSQFELRLAAVMAGDTDMIETFNSGQTFTPLLLQKCMAFRSTT